MRRRLLLLVVLVLLCALPAHGQSTTVSGQIIDSGGQQWFAGTIQFVFRVSPSNPSAQYMWNGAPFSSSSTFPQNPLSLDGTGSFSGLSIPSNTAIAPAGSQWAVTVCPAATVPNCFTKLLTITGATQNISSQVVPPPVVVNLSVPLLGARAYTDAEIVGGTPGIQYLNVTDNTIHLCVQAGFPPCTWVSQATGGTSMPTFNGVLFVGGGNSSFWGGGDIGSQINAAYSALPAPGGEVVVIPQANGLCYPFTTPIVATVASKYLLLEGWGADSQDITGGVSNGACIDYTPTTATTAITLDFVPLIGGGATRNHGIRNLRIVNNNCATAGGCGSSATGVSYTTTHAGGQNAYWDSFGVAGFGTGIKIATPATSPQATWGVVFSHGSLIFNTTGLVIPSGIELTVLDHMIVEQNATGWTMGSSSDLGIIAGSCDSNTVKCGSSTGGVITVSGGTHFENQGINSADYIDAGLTLHISGGFALDDVASGPAVDHWFSAPELTVTGMSVQTAGRVPAVVFKYNTSASVNVINLSGPSVLPNANIVVTVGGNAVAQIQDGTTPNGIQSPFFMADGGTAFSCAFVSLSAGWGSTAACSLPTGNNQRFSFVVTSNGSGVTVNPTVTVTLSQSWPVAPQYLCKVVGGTGAPGFLTGEQTTISQTVVGPIKYNATPAGGGASYQIACSGL